MMSPAKTRPAFDRSIIFTIAAVCIVALFISAYKVITYTDCSAVRFSVKKDQLVAGKIVTFRDQTPGSAEWEWAFGDSSETVSEKVALHVYKHPGEYVVELRVNGSCTVRKKVTIRKEKKLVNSVLYPSFDMPTTARVGERIRFTDRTEGAEEWKWSFGETMRVDARVENPAYSYKSSGTKTVTLIVNGKDRYATKKKITIFAKPVKKPEFDLKPRKKVEIKRKEPEIAEIPAVPPLRPIQKERAPEISRIQLEDYLLQISDEKREPVTLKPFMCEGYQTRVRANGEEFPLRVLFQEFKGNNITIESLDIVKNKQTRCINYIKIDYKRKKVLGIF